MLRITKSIMINLYSFFINAIINATILNIILIQAKITLLNSPLINIDSSIYIPVIINRMTCIILIQLLLLKKFY
ncbi:hypothetical protein CNEO2_20153 [Clostridium neonatale]|nr:hypothetical protein CNEO2_20153 [Clostridium neonatale]CAI3656439.1 hypothetical protein CNEO4_80143 [Clostridium neonatale]